MSKSFSEKCYTLLKKVPRGKVTTYKDIARALNSKAYRAVGTAMNKNLYPGSIQGKVPCHRVVNCSGKVGGFAQGTKKKAEMLKKEGVKIVKGKIDLKKYLYKLK